MESENQGSSQKVIRYRIVTTPGGLVIISVETQTEPSEEDILSWTAVGGPVLEALIALGLYDESGTPLRQVTWSKEAHIILTQRQSFMTTMTAQAL